MSKLIKPQDCFDLAMRFPIKVTHSKLSDALSDYTWQMFPASLTRLLYIYSLEEKIYSEIRCLND